MLDIYTLGDEVLREECKDITEFDSALRMLADAMLDTLDEADGVGLAGPQVGVPQKIFVVHISGNAPMYFINPSIIASASILRAESNFVISLHFSRRTSSPSV